MFSNMKKYSTKFSFALTLFFYLKSLEIIQKAAGSTSTLYSWISQSQSSCRGAARDFGPHEKISHSAPPQKTKFHNVTCSSLYPVFLFFLCVFGIQIRKLWKGHDASPLLLNGSVCQRVLMLLRRQEQTISCKQREGVQRLFWCLLFAKKSLKRNCCISTFDTKYYFYGNSAIILLFFSKYVESSFYFTAVVIDY